MKKIATKFYLQRGLNSGPLLFNTRRLVVLVFFLKRFAKLHWRSPTEAWRPVLLFLLHT